MGRFHNKKGFTLIETIVVLVILAVLAAILVPSLVGWIDRANELTCQINRSQIINHYHRVQALEYADGADVRLSDVLAGRYEVCADDVAGLTCPSGGTYTADDKNETIACSIHGAIKGGESGSGTGSSTSTTSTSTSSSSSSSSEGPSNTPDYFYLGGDEAYKVLSRGDLEKFDPKHDGQPGTIIPNGTVFYYRGDYYLFRNNQYFTDSTDEATFVAGYGVKIDITAIKTPSASTQPGDVKMVDGKAYVFFPYSRYSGDYTDNNYWFGLPLNGK